MANAIIYVNGSCHFSEQMTSTEVVGTGGYGAVIAGDGAVREISGGYSRTTNARMDILAIIRSLETISPNSTVTLYLANKNVIDTLTNGWLDRWHKNGYKKVKHADLWRTLKSTIVSRALTLMAKHIGELRNSTEFKRAEELSKSMSGMKNLPVDLRIRDRLTLLDQAAGFEPREIPLDAIEPDNPILDSICVDAATSSNPGPMEYRAVDTRTKQIIFEMKYAEATNNIGEFLAIVHALALYKKEGKVLKVVYSDSLNAISWVRQKACKTRLVRTAQNAKLFEHIDRAVSWLKANSYDAKVLKWNTAAWGEIPADYDRK